MIGDLARFALFNLAASLAAGLLVALVVLAVTRGLGLRDARVRSWLLGAALVKATLVLAGLSTFLPFALDWPMAAGSPVDFGAGPLPPAVVGPIILVWAGAALLVRVSLARRVRADGGHDTFQGAPAERLAASVERVAARARSIERSDGPCFRCTLPHDLPTPASRVSRSGAPVTLDPEGDPVIELPAELLAMLDDDELDAVVAHEVGHVVVARDREGCTPLWARVARWTSPGSLLVGRLLDREEELACDELAVRITGQPAALANALLKAYRRQRTPLPALAPVGRLLGGSWRLSDRVERLAATEPNQPATSMPRVAIACAVTLLASVAI
jgi:Zn-dependent protease with chaperone function